MPAVSKQRATPSANGAKPSQTMGDFRPISEVVDDYVHMLLYGRNRVGKTTLACEFPKPLLIVPIEPATSGGARSVRNREGVFTPPKIPRKAEDVRLIGQKLEQGHQFKTVVLDSGTSLDEMVLAEVCGWDDVQEMNRWGKVSQDQYTERSERMRKILRTFLGFQCNLIICCNEKDHNPPKDDSARNAMVKGIQNESFFAAAMGGGTTRWVQDGCDFICQLYHDKEYRTEERERKTPVPGGKPKIEKYTEEIETGKFVRRLRMKYHPNFSAGSRAEYSQSDDIPDAITADTPTEMYEKFMRIARGGN